MLMLPGAHGRRSKPVLHVPRHTPRTKGGFPRHTVPSLHAKHTDALAHGTLPSAHFSQVLTPRPANVASPQKAHHVEFICLAKLPAPQAASPLARRHEAGERSCFSLSLVIEIYIQHFEHIVAK